MAATIWFVMGLCAGYVISMVCMAAGRAELEQENIMLKEQNKQLKQVRGG